MKITKKLLSFSLISLTIFSGFSSFITNASYDSINSLGDDYYSEDIEVRTNYIRSEIIKKEGAEKIINSIDSIIEKIKNNEQALTKLQGKLEIAGQKNNNMYIRLVLEYISIKVDTELEKIDSINTDKKIAELTNSTVSSEDKTKFEDELVKIQLNLLENGTNNFKAFTDYFDKQTNLEEKGNMKMNLNIDQKEFGKLKSSLNLNNYIATTSNFDSQLKGEIDGLFESSIKNEEEIKLKLNGIIDFISKDGNMYLLLEKLNITDKQNVDKFQNYIDILEKVASQNKYIKFGDDNKEIALKLISSFSPTKMKTALSKPMFSAYKKEGNKYYMIPTKYSCDYLKQLGNFGGFIFGASSSECRNSEYRDILEELAKNGEIYMEIGDKTKIGFDFISSDYNKVKINGYVIFDDKIIDEVVLSVIPDQVENPNEKLTLNYKKNNNLDFLFYADKGDIDFKLSSKLDSNNKFSFIDFVSKDLNNYSNANLKLENNIFNGNFKFDNEVSGVIDGTTNLDNTLKSLNIDYSNKDKSLNGKINYIENKFNIENHSKDEYSSLDLLLNGKWNSIEKNLDAGNLEISVKSKSYETNKFIENFKANLVLKDTLINGYSLIKDYKGKDAFAIKTSGKYQKDYLELNNKMAFLSPMNNLDKVIGTLNLGSDLRNGLDNVNIYFDASISDKKIIDFELINTGTIEYKKTEIITPTNTIDAKDLKLETNSDL